MRPPICDVCRRKAKATVAFADYERLPDGMVGHPRGLGWFCGRHLGAARSLAERSESDALAAIRRRGWTGWLGLHALVVAVSAALAIRGHDPAGSAAAPGSESAVRWMVYVFKPLTTALLWALAAWPRPMTIPGYRTPILIGLAFSLLGDVFLMIPADWFLAGLASFAVTHVLYLVAFSSDSRFAARLAPFFLTGAFATVLVIVLWPGIDGQTRIPVLIYAGLLAAMAAQSVSRAGELGRASTRVAAAGALLFLLSDAVLALDRFRFPFAESRAVVLTLYFTAQWLIALSVELYHSEG